MDEARKKELRGKAEEAIERWSLFMTAEKIIEEMMGVLEEAKSRNQAKEMVGFRFIWERETSNWAVFPTWDANKACEEVVPLTPAVTKGRCRACTYFEVMEFWKDIKTLQSSKNELEEIQMTEFIFK